MGAEDVFYDVGCGAGRVLCVVAQGRIRKCVGVELTPQLCHLARENARNLRGGHTAIEIVEGDATRADYSDGTVFFFYNPFGAETLEEVLRRIRESVLLRPRRIQCIYLNPTARHVFENQGWLKLTARRSLGTGKTLAHYYSSVE
jgi:precorrin-6B methylase 2